MWPWYCDCWIWFTTGLLLGVTVVIWLLTRDKGSKF
jgi:hypothetical protein